MSTPNTRPTSIATSAFTSIQPIDNDNTGDDDGWGDFEVAPDTGLSSAPLGAISATPISANAKQPTPIDNFNKRPTRIVRASTLDLVSNNLFDFRETSTPQPSRTTKPPVLPVKPSPKPLEPKVHMRSDSINHNVLFDADDFEGEHDREGSEDDFGDFETMPPLAHPPSDLLSSALFVPSPNTPAAKNASELLMDLHMDEPPSKPIQSTQTNTVQSHIKIPKPQQNKPKPYSEISKPQSSRTDPKPQTLEDDWDSFSDWPNQPTRLETKTLESTWDWDSVEPSKSNELGHPKTKTSTPQSNEATMHNEDTLWDWDPIDMKTNTAAEMEDSALPPINIPPPSVLLSAFPQLFDQANEYLYKPVSAQSQSIKDRILSDTKAHDFLRGFLSLAVVAARIIAGRKMRWHRDKFLAQSMSISAAGSKGMKLAGVDKTQTAREDREAADVVSSWKSQVGRLRSTVASANSAKRNGGNLLKVPEITDTMQIQTARDVPTAPKACVICGLKRNERLAKVDYEIEDSFGEWWVEHWGHVACKRFWIQHENTLRQR